MLFLCLAAEFSFVFEAGAFARIANAENAKEPENRDRLSRENRAFARPPNIFGSFNRERFLHVLLKSRISIDATNRP
jgi:hypothetical protein